MCKLNIDQRMLKLQHLLINIQFLHIKTDTI